MEWSDQKLLESVKRGDVRAVSRLITLAENHVSRAQRIEKKLYKETGHATVVGVTGSPGAGKSTLVDKLTHSYRKEGKKVGILAVDPTSPYSGGAILGDRIRMMHATEDPDVFVRSLATRGALGGVSQAVTHAIHILDAAGFDLIIVETVGVGQAEVDIVRMADTCVVVLVPGMGDSVQAIKAGILEIADIFAINKADRDGVHILERDLLLILGLVEHSADDWMTPIIQTIATECKGIDQLTDAVKKHSLWLASSQQGQLKKLQIMRETILQFTNETLIQKIKHKCDKQLNSLSKECLLRKMDPFTASKQIIKSL